MVQPSTGTFLQILSQRIGGYDGYELKQQRQESDRRMRKFLVTYIKTLLDALTAFPKASLQEDQPRLQDLTASTKRMLNTIGQSLSEPTYTGTSFFFLDQLPAKRLDHIYKFENTMVTELLGVAEELQSLKSKELFKTVIEDHFLHIKDFIDNFNQALFERESLILGNDKA